MKRGEAKRILSCYLWRLLGDLTLERMICHLAYSSTPGARDARGFFVRNLEFRNFNRFLLRTAPGCLLAVLLTAVCFWLHLSFAVTGFLYLIVVVLQSLRGNFTSSTLVSVLTVLCLDYFFVPPFFSLQVANPLDGVALLSFLVTGLVITRLTTQVREAATISESQRRQMNRLYEVASRLLAIDPEDELLSRTVEFFCEEFDLSAVCLYDSLHEDIYSAGNSERGLAEKTRATCLALQDSNNEAGLVFRCLRAAGQTIGAVGFDGLADPDVSAGALSTLATAMLERHRAFLNASHSAAAAQVEVFRGAVLDALAHEFKTPLATILTAAGCLREIGVESETHEELAELIETESSRLCALTSRVLRTSKLDSDEIKPRLEPTNISDLVAELVSQYSEQCTDRQIRATELRPAEVLADCELLQLAIRQLLENACKYSPLGSPVGVSVETDRDSAAIRVCNAGPRINDKERGRIFERFYRGAQSRQTTPGSGLGLYFAKKIVRAHGGSVELEEERLYSESSTVFRINLPLARTA
jgi:two-component system sensor histidine kinase KdpD